MKTALPYLLFFIAFNSFAQITLEHTYTNSAVTRIKLENSGEKYYELKRETNELYLYDSNHTLWKTILLPAPLPSPEASITVMHVSDTKINSDPKIEIIIGFFDVTTSTYTCRIISESGTILLNLENTTNANVVELPELPNKLITENTYNESISKVYSLPEFNLENTYKDGLVKRIELENSGEKYYLLDELNNNAKVYNSNHTIWKTINLPKPERAFYENASIDAVSETRLNPDVLLEIAYSYYHIVNGRLQWESKIINENNEVLLTVPYSKHLSISSIKGLPNKLIAEIRQNISGFIDSTSIYNLPSLAIENAYEAEVTRVKLDYSGEKYCTKYLREGKQVKIYNSNHTLWKTINLLSNQIEENIVIDIISENIIDPNILVELAYTSTTVLSNGSIIGRSNKVISENGTILLDGIYFVAFYVSQITGLQNKLIGNTIDYSDGSSKSKVYSIGTLGVQDNYVHKVFISPNPTKSFLNIHAIYSTIVEATIYNIYGAIVKKENAQNITKIDVDKLPAGNYIVNLTDSNNQKSTHKITVSH